MSPANVQFINVLLQRLLAFRAALHQQLHNVLQRKIRRYGAEIGSACHQLGVGIACKASAAICIVDRLGDLRNGRWGSRTRRVRRGRILPSGNSSRFNRFRQRSSAQNRAQEGERPNNCLIAKHFEYPLPVKCKTGSGHDRQRTMVSPNRQPRITATAREPNRRAGQSALTNLSAPLQASTNFSRIAAPHNCLQLKRYCHFICKVSHLVLRTRRQRSSSLPKHEPLGTRHAAHAVSSSWRLVPDSPVAAQGVIAAPGFVAGSIEIGLVATSAPEPAESGGFVNDRAAYRDASAAHRSIHGDKCPPP